MRILILFLFLLAAINIRATAQMAIYDANFNACKECLTINSFADKIGAELNSQNYKIGDEYVAELYYKSTGRIAGFALDTALVDISKLRYFRQDKRMNYLMSKYSIPVAVSIYKGEVSIGMNAEQAIDSWGKPERVSRTTLASVIKEQWVYGNGNYLYFENGILTTIQN